jgi:hypothetical protein
MLPQELGHATPRPVATSVASVWRMNKNMTLTEQAKRWQARSMLTGKVPPWWQRAVIRLLLGKREATSTD